MDQNYDTVVSILCYYQAYLLQLWPEIPVISTNKSPQVLDFVLRISVYFEGHNHGLLNQRIVFFQEELWLKHEPCIS